jgi:hypothetical protein
MRAEIQVICLLIFVIHLQMREEEKMAFCL